MQTDVTESEKKSGKTSATTSADDPESDETTATAATDGSEATDESSAAESTAEESPADSAGNSEQAAETPVTPSTPEPASEPEEPAPQKIYQDGTFTGRAFGYDGDIIVQVTIQDDRIIDISGSTEESDELYFIDAKNVVFPAILDTQSTEVDACTGATCSSDGIMAAVRAALDSARI